MAGSSSSNQDIFDVRKIRRLVELMKEHDLSEIDLRQGETRVQLRRVGESTAAESVAGSAADAPAASPAPVEAPAPATPARPVSSPKQEHVAFVTSPMVGTFYAAPDPDSAAYVKVGDTVGPDTTVCIVEAMKVFNEIQAEISGKIVAVLLENGEPVEYGQPMFKVDTRQ